MRLASEVLIWAGVVIAAVGALRLLLARDSFVRLHFIAPGTVLAAPLVITGLAVRSWSSWHDVVKLVFIAVLMVATGPATVLATARARKVPDG